MNFSQKISKYKAQASKTYDVSDWSLDLVPDIEILDFEPEVKQTYHQPGLRYELRLQLVGFTLDLNVIKRDDEALEAFKNLQVGDTLKLSMRGEIEVREDDEYEYYFEEFKVRKITWKGSVLIAEGESEICDHRKGCG